MSGPVRIPKDLQERARETGGAAVVVGILYADGCRSSLSTVVHSDQAHSIIDKALEIGVKRPSPSTGSAE